MRVFQVAAVLSALALPARAEVTELRPGPGADTTAANCAACHSLDYIKMNAPFLDQAGWTAEVAKMVNVFRAPIEPSLMPEIVDYLTRHYGPAPR
jgi:mono/diheme cytochrome c family protein